MTDSNPSDDNGPLPATWATTEDLLLARDRCVQAASACFERSDVAGAVESLRQLEHATTDETTLALTDRFFPGIAAGRHIVATFNPRRMPAADEVVIIYGNYPLMYGNVVVNNPIRRHLADFWAFSHDRVESDPRWHGIDRICVINLDDRRDRYDSVLRELASAGAPFDRITRVSASRADNATPLAGHIACMQSHIATLRLARDGGWNHALVLEDDFCFTSDLDAHLGDLATFVTRDYDYWICLVATSKYGEVIPKDDLVSMSHQRCTNAGGYLVSRAGIEQLLPIYDRALEGLKSTGDVIAHAVDRCWSVLQPSGRFLVFSRKFGFQVSSFSNIERAVSRYLD